MKDDKKKIDILDSENQYYLQKYEELFIENLELKRKLNSIIESDLYKLACRLNLKLLRKTKNYIKSLLFYRKKEENRVFFAEQQKDISAYKPIKSVGVVTQQHTIFIAYLFRSALSNLGVECKIVLGEPSKFDDIPYIIICPQILNTFPKCYLVYQLEQTSSSLWFTERYYSILNTSCTCFDYSNFNIAYFSSKKTINTQLFFLPIDYLRNYYVHQNKDKEYDVLFYGDISCSRRRKMLEQISHRFSVHICSGLFGHALYSEIEKAKIVINIHFYENALLETTRIYEVLSLNTCLVISEKGIDEDSFERISDVVEFVDINDVQAMIRKIEYWLKNDVEREQRIRDNELILSSKPSLFDISFTKYWNDNIVASC